MDMRDVELIAILQEQWIGDTQRKTQPRYPIHGHHKERYQDEGADGHQHSRQ